MKLDQAPKPQSRFAGLRALMSPTMAPLRTMANITAPAPTCPAVRTASPARHVAKAYHNPVAAIRAEERTRIAAVFASDQVTGREMSAALLLAETTMSADAIVATLAGLSRGAAAEQQARKALGDVVANRNGNGPAQNYGWAEIHARIGTTKARG